MHARIAKLPPDGLHHRPHLRNLIPQPARKQRLMERLQPLHHLQIIPRPDFLQLLVERPRADGHGEPFGVDVFEASRFHPGREVRAGRGLDAVGAVGGEAGGVGFVRDGAEQGVVRGGPFEVEVDELSVATRFSVAVVQVQLRSSALGWGCIWDILVDLAE